MPKRNRGLYFLLIAGTIALGLFSRTNYIPELIYPYLGDALYAVLIYFGIGFLFSSLPYIKTLMVSTVICFIIEGSQCYQADWILDIRQTQIGALVLGHGFLWSDLLAYLVGGLFALMIELKLLSRFRQH